MLIETLSVLTDADSENALVVTADCREVIIVKTQTVSVPPAPDTETRERPAGRRTRGKSRRNASPYSRRGSDNGRLYHSFGTRTADFTIALGGKEYRLTVRWFDAPEGGWLLDLATVEDEPVIAGIPLVAGCDLLEQYGYLGTGGKLAVSGDVPPTWTTWGKT